MRRAGRTRARIHRTFTRGSRPPLLLKSWPACIWQCQQSQAQARCPDAFVGEPSLVAVDPVGDPVRAGPTAAVRVRDVRTDQAAQRLDLIPAPFTPADSDRHHVEPAGQVDRLPLRVLNRGDRLASVDLQLVMQPGDEVGGQGVARSRKARIPTCANAGSGEAGRPGPTWITFDAKIARALSIASASVFPRARTQRPRAFATCQNGPELGSSSPRDCCGTRPHAHSQLAVKPWPLCMSMVRHSVWLSASGNEVATVCAGQCCCMAAQAQSIITLAFATRSSSVTVSSCVGSAAAGGSGHPGLTAGLPGSRRR